MSEAAGDPYQTLGVRASVSDAELRRVYRALVKRYHPDHNGGSRESSARFAEIQDAYARVLSARTQARGGAAASAGVRGDDIEQRIAAMEREVSAARAAQRRTRPAQPGDRERASAWTADVAAAWSGTTRPSREQLGYYDTDDTFGRILDDASTELRRRLHGRDRSEFTRHLTDLFADRDGEDSH